MKKKNERIEQICAVLYQQNRDFSVDLSAFLAKIKAQRELPELLQSIFVLNDQKSDCKFSINRSLLEAINEHFQALSTFAAHQQAKELLEMLRNREKEDKQGKRNIILLLRSLVEQTALLSANYLRELIKTELVKQCIQLWKNDDRDLAAQLIIILLQTLLIELAYLRAVSTEKNQKQLREEAQTIWADLLSQIQDFENCPFLQMCAILLLNAIRVEEENIYDEGSEENGIVDIKKCCKKIAKKVCRNKLLEICTLKMEEELKQRNNNNDVMEIEDLAMPIQCSYNSALFDLLSHYLVTFCMLNSKLNFPILNFLVTFAQNQNSLHKLLNSMAKNPEIRFGAQLRESIESILLQIIPNGHKFCKMGKIRWRKLAGENLQNAGNRKRRRKTQNQMEKENGELPHDWNGLLGIFKENCNENEQLSSPTEEQLEMLSRALSHFSNAKFGEILSTAKFRPKSPKLARPILCLLYSICCQRKSLKIPLRLELADLILAEPEPKINSLKLAAKMLPMFADQLDSIPHLPDFCTLCLATFIPSQQLMDRNENEKRQFLMAQLAFLRSLLINMPKLLSGLAPLIVQLLPDFFSQISEYRRQRPSSGVDWRHDQFADRFEHCLSGVCRELQKRRTHFGHLLPFVVANCLTGERELRFPLFLLMSTLDENDMAVLSANLPTMEKRKFDLLRKQFHECNKIIG